ncbi:GntR family transcriptional regulator / MocR family aminotransferase [Amycolatopsis arida]|uniref:GntR family transcriptional regulator / MocR family aminotransferase n=1 Tax=Amycolatopsis arida TaxID=587909 RepID=A0A1I5PC55_9PSEU|nr:PLP-dependent aminotransferase family protein [Amycolatopsis arida]TDX98443.1 GntR family transcriptional regulator/MocR family aminotransferase [Amycolatopsis arida]SFP31635.1 GntR family transcriptional regulator / MocR family aminotransferase [Amycolatopsis arida]
MAKSWSSSDLHLDWDRSTGWPGLAEALRAAVRSNRLPHGTALPSTRALAQDLGVARGTVTKVYEQLAAEGYLRTQQGSVTRVATTGAPPSSPPHPARTPPAPRWTLLPGRPDFSSFPRALWASATRRVLQTAPPSAFDYPDVRGTAELRAALARYLARSRGVLADPERTVVCGGHAHAVSLLATVLRERGAGEIAFEDPSLPIFRDVAATAGLRVTGAGVDADGVLVAELSELDAPAAVVTPAHQYPLGHTLAPARRAELVRWATGSGGVVVEDDYDGEFRFDRQPVGALQALAPERVVYAGTASKTLAPALRLSWLVLPRDLVDPVLAAMAGTGWRAPALEQLVLAELLDSGAYDLHVRRRRAAYRSRRDRLLAALPEALRPTGISAGLHLVLPLPAGGPTEEEVQAAATRRSLAVEVLGRHWMRPRPDRRGIVVGYAHPAEHAFAPTVRALLATLADLGLT